MEMAKARNEQKEKPTNEKYHWEATTHAKVIMNRRQPMPRRIYRLSDHFPGSHLLNVCIEEEIIIEPQAALGIHLDRQYKVRGIKKRELRVGLGLSGWPEPSAYPRYDISQLETALSLIDSKLAPTENDILIGWLEPAHFTKLSPNTNTLYEDLETSPAPQNVSKFKGIKVLLVGDTHHHLLTIRNAIDYCLKESWDAILLCHQPIHIDWFRSALGEDRVFIYNLQASAEELGGTQTCQKKLHERNNQLLTFYGDFSHLHPRRNKIVQELLEDKKENGFKHKGRMPASEWFNTIAEDAHIMTACLNNQISTYQIYSMLQGCLVFSDQLNELNGWGKIFKDADSIVFYETSEQLIALYKYYRENQQEAEAIAQRGQALAEKHFELNTLSNRWLLAESPGILRAWIQESSYFLENIEGKPIRWSSIEDLKEDLTLYQILQDLSIFYSRIHWIPSNCESSNLKQAVQEQLPRCSIETMIKIEPQIDLCPIVMSRIPKLHEINQISKLDFAFLLIVLSEKEINESKLQLAKLTEWIDRKLEVKIIKNTISRKQLGIMQKSPATANALWPLGSQINAIIIKQKEEFESLTPLYKVP